jgi:bacteriocin-like protein
MRKKAPKHKSKPADTPLKASKKKDIELTEKELDKVSGGRQGPAGVHFAKATLFLR